MSQFGSSFDAAQRRWDNMQPECEMDEDGMLPTPVTIEDVYEVLARLGAVTHAGFALSFAQLVANMATHEDYYLKTREHLRQIAAEREAKEARRMFKAE